MNPRSAQDLEQTVSVSVTGGRMTISPASFNLTLTRDGRSDRYRAVLPQITVVDARGTLAGWTAEITPIDLPPQATFKLNPGEPVAVYGNQREVQSARTSTASASRPAALMSAAPEGGGGTFEVDGTVVVTVPHAHASQTTLHVALTVA